MTAHTPGPWEADFGGTLGHIKSASDRRDGGTPTVARYDMHALSISDEESKANARLIAASPEMLALLVDIYDGMHRGQGPYYSASDGEIAEAIFDKMCSLLGNDWTGDQHGT